MDCQICGSSEFCTRLGITYCTECNSQIEETQTETNVDFVQSSKDLLSSSFVKKTAKEDDIEFRDWITAECYNYIIFMQVSALIKLGASPKLKDSVLHIWTKYLQKCEIAFRIDYQAGDNTPHLGPVPHVRDVKVLYEDKRIPRYKRKRSGKSSCSVTSGEESGHSESDNSGYTTDTASTVSSVSSKKKIYSFHTRKLYKKGSSKRKIISYRNKIFNMTFQKTLSFCYLGLLYSEDQLSLCDLIRFVYEDKVPYLVINDKLPPFLKLQFKDSGAFLRYHVPEASVIFKTALQIAEFLKLPRFKEPSIHLVISRYVKDLNLPDDINPIVDILIRSYEEKIFKFKKGPKLKDEPIDHQALCFIIIALKMLFVLDSKFENEHSKAMKKLNAIHPDKNYFVWQEWREHSMIKEYLFLPKTPGTYMIGKLDSLSSDRMISKYPFTRLKPKDYIPQYRFQMGRYDIQNVLSNIVHIPEKINILPTSFPLRTEVNDLIQEWNTVPLFKETKTIDFTVLQKDFSSCSLNYDPKQFDEIEDELSYLLMTALYSPDSVLDVSFFSRVPPLHQITSTTSKYWFMCIPNIEKQCGSEYSKMWFKRLPSSFKWLINFFCKYIYCDNSYLYKNIILIEKALFFETKKFSQSSYSKISNKVIVDF